MTTRVAFLFPGQGSQSVGMGADIFATSASAQRVFSTVDEALGFPLSDLCFHGPEETLRKTINAQPAIIMISLAYLAAFQEALSPSSSSWCVPLIPDFIAGHSVGEFAALVAGGVLDLKSALLLVRERGRLMDAEETACPGGMAAVLGIETEVLQEICEEVTQQLTSDLNEEHHPGQGRVIIANYNAPGQVVISGEQRALERACQLAKERGAKRVRRLAVSGAFHSPVMSPAVAGMAQKVATTPLQDARIPIISNITATPLTSAQELRGELAQQLAASVQWTNTINYLSASGVTTFIEIGPGQVLTGMVKRTLKEATLINIGSMVEVERAAAQIREMGLFSGV